ncbi:MAG: sodium:alanine symporter, partial [Lachnospiraceae bacterium]|nr:sodium:alanine symporter [Lachnospiraceae bacterium]
MMAAISDAILAFTNWVWGIPMLLAIAGGGFYLSVRMRFLQFRKLPFIMKNTIVESFVKKGENGK